MENTKEITSELKTKPEKPSKMKHGEETKKAKKKKSCWPERKYQKSNILGVPGRKRKWQKISEEIMADIFPKFDENYRLRDLTCSTNRHEKLKEDKHREHHSKAHQKDKK